MFRYLILVLLIAGLVTIFHSAGEALDKSLVLWFSFTGSGNVAKDLSGNGNDGTIVGAKRVDGKYGKGISIGKKDEYIEISNVLQPEGTIEFWFKPNWNGNDGQSYRLFDANTGAIYWLIGQGKSGGGSTDKFGFWFEDAADADFQNWQTPSNVISAGKWHHVAATWDFNKKEAKFYINGEEVSKVAGLGDFPPLNPKPKIGFNVGTGYMPANNGADSVIDEFAIYAKVLEANEVKRDMAQLAFAVELSYKLSVMWGRIKSEH